MTLKINEIFYSIQGESTYAGLPCVFVRVTGCNLRCSYCDTTYAYEDGIEMSIDEILDEVKSYECKLVEVTGGEPLMQKKTPLLIDRLIKCDFRVLIETNGTFDIGIVNKKAVKIVDIKSPSSGFADKNLFENLDKIDEKDEVKFVIGDEKDYDYAKKIVLGYNLFLKTKNVLFSPVSGKEKWLANEILKDNLKVRLNIQTHKFIWGDTKEGIR